MKRERKFDKYGRVLRKDGTVDGRSGVTPTPAQRRARESGARLRILCGAKANLNQLAHFIQAQARETNDNSLYGIAGELFRIKETLELMEVDYRAACGMKPKENPYAD